jgi:hypothetical protein
LLRVAELSKNILSAVALFGHPVFRQGSSPVKTIVPHETFSATRNTTSTPAGLAQFMKNDFELRDKLIKSQAISLDYCP